VAAEPAHEERNAVAIWFLCARLLARTYVGFVARRSVIVDLAFGHVAFLVIEIIIFDILPDRTFDRPPVCTLSHEEAAPPFGVVCHALTPDSIIASLRALIEVAVFARTIFQIDLVVAHVAFLSRIRVACTPSFACVLLFLDIFNFFRVRITHGFCLLALGGKVAARPVVVVRNAHTRFLVLARLLARRKGSCCAPRQPFLAIGHVAF